MIEINRHAVIVAVASAVIVSSAGYSTLNVMALDSMQIKWNDRSSFDFMTMLRGGVVDVCNTAPLPVSFNGMSVATHYKGQEVGVFETGGASVQSGSEQSLTGRGIVTGLVGNIFSPYSDAELSGNGMVRVSSDNMTVVVTIKTVVFGMIPFEVSEEHHGQEFFNMMNDKSGDYSC